MSALNCLPTIPERERIVVLGSGWAGYVLARALDPKKFQTVVVSPRSYFVFTPLLASCSVGTLEFRTALEPIRSRRSTSEFYQGWADDVDFNKKTVQIEESVMDPMAGRALVEDRHEGPEGQIKQQMDHMSKKGKLFELKYDKLVVSVGCYSQTFNTPGVKEHAFFLKDVGDSRGIRKRVLECFETASLPTTSETLRKHLLNFAVVGGGPTGIEFSAELHDLINEDLKKMYPDLVKSFKITVYDIAPNVLSMFDESLGKYAMDTFKREGIDIQTSHHIEELRTGLPAPEMGAPEIQDPQGCYTLRTKEEGDIGVGMVVWSTGLMMNPFVEKAMAKVHSFPTASAATTGEDVSEPRQLEWQIKQHERTGGVLTDDNLRVKLAAKTGEEKFPEAIMQDVFALGDCAVMENSPDLPATAQVANQKGEWLAKMLNSGDVGKKSFSYKNLGVMAYIGNWNAVMQSGGDNNIKGRVAWLIWRGAYLTKSVSWRNRILIPTYWALNWLFGRDISRF
ncbi:MAG: hypothetical protein M1812_000356 [Candelaria pacifica]|nr:MAG: hypothetical protein M1812_000356 [Candelaria pacifica]